MQLKAYRQSDLGVIIPIYNSSAGHALGLFVTGKLGLRLHYFMSGYRNYSLTNALQHFIKALFPEG
jgi:hypothetical protein